MPGIRGSSGTVDRNLSSAALNASGFPVMSRRDLGRVLNKRGPRIAKEFSRVFLTDGGDVEDVPCLHKSGSAVSRIPEMILSQLKIFWGSIFFLQQNFQASHVGFSLS